MRAFFVVVDFPLSSRYFCILAFVGVCNHPTCLEALATARKERLWVVSGNFLGPSKVLCAYHVFLSLGHTVEAFFNVGNSTSFDRGSFFRPLKTSSDRGRLCQPRSLFSTVYDTIKSLTNRPPKLLFDRRRKRFGDGSFFRPRTSLPRPMGGFRSNMEFPFDHRTCGILFQPRRKPLSTVFWKLRSRGAPGGGGGPP